MKIIKGWQGGGGVVSHFYKYCPICQGYKYNSNIISLIVFLFATLCKYLANVRGLERLLKQIDFIIKGSRSGLRLDWSLGAASRNKIC